MKKTELLEYDNFANTNTHTCMYVCMYVCIYIYIYIYIYREREREICSAANKTNAKIEFLKVTQLEVLHGLH